MRSGERTRLQSLEVEASTEVSRRKPDQRLNKGSMHSSHDKNEFTQQLGVGPDLAMTAKEVGLMAVEPPPVFERLFTLHRVKI